MQYIVEHTISYSLYKWCSPSSPPTLHSSPRQCPNYCIATNTTNTATTTTTKYMIFIKICTKNPSYMCHFRSI